VSQTKQSQRISALARRDEIPQDVREQFSKALVAYADGLSSLSSDFDGKIIAGFWPIRSEIDPVPLMEELAIRGAQLALPALIRQGKNTEMIFRSFDPDKPLVAMGFDTFGPASAQAQVQPDIVLLPLAAFDRQGNRIGYGAGFYDRTLAEMRMRGLAPKLIGLAFDCQQEAQIAAEPHDIRLDAILTERGLTIFDDDI